MPISPARAAAFDILLRVERESSYASELLHAKTFERLSTPDHALLTELVMGVLRWRSRLDDEIEKASSQPLRKLDLEILIALRLALYQFRLLTRIPHRAALHESVELVKRARKRSAAAFVNAVLRKLSAQSTSPEFSLSSSASSAANSLSPAELAAACAHPLWLVEKWTSEYGLCAAAHICRYNQSIPPTTIRLRTQAAERELRDEGISLQPGSILNSARRVESGNITHTRVFRDAHVVIQDEASQLVADLIGRDLSANSRILDCCAAPGGKTRAIADRNPAAEILALELHPHRARLMHELLGAHATRISIAVADARNLPAPAIFNRILTDVPCSGTGTLSRHPEIKWRLKPDDLRELHDLQLAILRSALAHLAPGGRLIYSTCSLEKEENEHVVEQILTEEKSIRLIDCQEELRQLKSSGDLIWTDLQSLTRGPCLRTIPGIHPCDGFFAAILKKEN